MGTVGTPHGMDVTAVQRGLTALSAGVTLVGVSVNIEQVSPAVDANHAPLAPPTTGSDGFERRFEDFGIRGTCAGGTHNAAREAVDMTGTDRP